METSRPPNWATRLMEACLGDKHHPFRKPTLSTPLSHPREIMNCPQCNANDIARCCVIFAQGTFSGASRATAYGSYVPGIGFDQATVYGSSSSMGFRSCDVRTSEVFGGNMTLPAGGAPLHQGSKFKPGLGLIGSRATISVRGLNDGDRVAGTICNLCGA